MTYQDAVFTMNVYREKIGKYQEADLAFQANKYSRWEQDQKSGYVQSLILGKAPSKFIFADAELCLKSSQERGDKGDIKYYQNKVDRDIKYINVDSNNRNNVIIDFMNNKISIPHGKYNIQGAVVVVDEENDTYENLNEILLDAFNQSIVTVSVYTDATREELSELFRNVNDGKPLNHPEILNSYTTSVANTIRELADTYGDYFVEQGKWFNGASVNRRGIDQFISHMAFVFAYDIKKSISKTNMENFYRDGSDGEQQILNFRKTFNSFMKDVMTKDAYAIANRNSVFDLFIIYCEMKDKKLKINDNWEFLKSYMKAVATLLTNGKRYENEEFKDPKSFETMVGGTQKANNVLRNELIKEIFDVESLTTKLDTKRGYSTTDKMILAVNSGFMTPEGKEIVPSELHTNKYHGGHVDPYKDGGATTLENGVIQTSQDNLKLGGNPLKISV
jgi:hypothetical protein